MKKNKMMRLASSLLVAVLLTSSVISGTFAKYVTEGSATDSARVAKWGVNVNVTGDEAFAPEYDKTDTRTNAELKNIEAISKTVIAANGTDNLVAPGTNGYLGTVAVTGTPEVAVEVKTELVTFNVTGWAIDGDDFYCPIIITVEDSAGATTVINGDTFGTVDSFVSAVRNAVANAVPYAFAPNTDLSTVGYLQKTITWEWTFHVDEEHDAKDTKLGNLATAPEIEFEVKTTVTQVD